MHTRARGERESLHRLCDEELLLIAQQLDACTLASLACACRRTRAVCGREARERRQRLRTSMRKLCERVTQAARRTEIQGPFETQKQFWVNMGVARGRDEWEPDGDGCARLGEHVRMVLPLGLKVSRLVLSVRHEDDGVCVEAEGAGVSIRTRHLKWTWSFIVQNGFIRNTQLASEMRTHVEWLLRGPPPVDTPAWIWNAGLLDRVRRVHADIAARSRSEDMLARIIDTELARAFAKGPAVIAA